MEAAAEWNDLVKKWLEYDGLLAAANAKCTLNRLRIILTKIYFF